MGDGPADKPTVEPVVTPSSRPRSRVESRRSASSRIRSLGNQVWSAVALPLLAIVLALIVGAIVIILTGALEPGASISLTLPLEAYAALWEGSLGSANGRVSTLVQAAPLILAGLGVGLASRLVYSTSVVRASFSSAQSRRLPWVVALEGTGAACRDLGRRPCGDGRRRRVGLHPGLPEGLLRRPRSRHHDHAQLHCEVPHCVPDLGTAQAARLSPQPVTAPVSDAALPILFGRDGHIGILIAFAAVPVFWFLLNKMTLGFEIRAVGANPEAARYAGMKPRRLVILTMSIAGLMAGLAGDA